jgi:hypothetical protein
MLLPMHLEITIRLKTTILHMRGSVLLLYGLSYILGPIFMAPISFCIPTTSLSRNVYIMIMIEHFSKWVKFVVLLNKSSHSTSHAFL